MVFASPVVIVFTVVIDCILSRSESILQSLMKFGEVRPFFSAIRPYLGQAKCFAQEGWDCAGVYTELVKHLFYCFSSPKLL